MERNIFVIGLDEVNIAALEMLPDAGRYRFHRLLTIEELQQGDEIPLADLLEKASRQLAQFRGPVDAIVGYWDFPVSSMVPILADRFGLRSASLEAVVKCEHKYWSRLEQQKVIDEYPRFALVDLETDPPEPPALRRPFWLKPVKSFSSELAFKVDDDADFVAAVEQIREGIGRVATPFEFLLQYVDLPQEIAEAGGHSCVAEETIGGRQVTVEGYSFEGDVTVYGVIDSISYPGSSSFLRYQYPSELPDAVTDRMADIARRVIAHIGLDTSTFNIEFFWDESTDRISLLEINPRHSQSHAHLFADVDGIPNHHCMVELALGNRPQLLHGDGPYDVAAKWFLRHFSDGIVRRAPTAEDVARIQEEVPGTIITPIASEGDRLSELPEQDSYSFNLANVYIGAADTEDLQAKYERCVTAMGYVIDDVEREPDTDA